MTSYVYFIKDITSNKTKIGRTDKNPNARLSQLQTGNCNKLIVLNYIECKTTEESVMLESALHQKYNYLNYNGEWFEHCEDFEDRFIHEKIFNDEQRREPLLRETLYGKEIAVSRSKMPRCYFYPEYTAQIKASYEDSLRLQNPYRTMKYPTYGKQLLLPFSDQTNRVFISHKKHLENLELQNFVNSKKSQSLETFLLGA